MTSIAATRRAQAHAKHAFYCTCGKIVSGNGGKYNHRQMHERAGDTHCYITQTSFNIIFPNWWELPEDQRFSRKVFK